MFGSGSFPSVPRVLGGGRETTFLNSQTLVSGDPDYLCIYWPGYGQNVPALQVIRS